MHFNSGKNICKYLNLCVSRKKKHVFAYPFSTPQKPWKYQQHALILPFPLRTQCTVYISPPHFMCATNKNQPTPEQHFPCLYVCMQVGGCGWERKLSSHRGESEGEEKTGSISRKQTIILATNSFPKKPSFCREAKA